MGQVYGAGGKTVPKKGRLGTGSYYPEGTPLYQHRGNVFPGITVLQPSFPQITFGEPARAGINTQSGQPRAQSIALHPNKAQYNLITLPLTPAMVVSSPGDNVNLTPVPPSQEPLAMPHERNTNSASGTKKKPNAYRTVFGASRTMTSDTAFQANPGANYKHSVRIKPKPAIEAQKKTATSRTFAQQPGTRNQTHRTPPPSFVSNGNIWYDPNNSFIAGQAGGTGRWAQVKRGVV